MFDVSIAVGHIEYLSTFYTRKVECRMMSDGHGHRCLQDQLNVIILTFQYNSFINDKCNKFIYFVIFCNISNLL